MKYLNNKKRNNPNFKKKKKMGKRFEQKPHQRQSTDDKQVKDVQHH